MGEKWPVSQQPSATIPPLALPLFMLRQRTGPLLSQRPGLKVSMDLWTYPMIIPQAVSCEEGWGVSIREKEKNRPNDEREMRSKKLLHLGRTGRHRSQDQQVICFEIHSHDSCPGLSCPYCPPSPFPNIPSLTVFLLSTTALSDCL